MSDNVPADVMRARLDDLLNDNGWTRSAARHLLAPKKSKRNRGSGWEREFCKLISTWWTGGHRDDAFWRTAGSGGRATVRARRGVATTAYQHGDICPTDEVGGPLCDVFTWELKQGYEDATLHQVLDSPGPGGHGGMATHIRQAHAAHVAAGSMTWALVHRRTRRAPMVWFGAEVWQRCRREHGAWSGHNFPVCLAQVQALDLRFVGMPMDEFMTGITPAAIRKLASEVR